MFTGCPGAAGASAGGGCRRRDGVVFRQVAESGPALGPCCAEPVEAKDKNDDAVPMPCLDI